MTQLRRKKVFVVDDETTIHELIRDALCEQGIDTECFESGAGLLEYLKEHPFDIGIIDLDLPGKHGPAIAEELRQHGISIPLLAISAYVGAELNARTWDHETLLDCGFNDTLAKPFKVDDLFSKLTALLNRAS